MELKTAIEIFEHHQEWRLGKREDMIYEPKKLTEAIDMVLKEVETSTTNRNDSHTIYAFMFNSCVHESSWATVSLHYSEDSAIKAMEKHRQEELERFNNIFSEEQRSEITFGENSDWCVIPFEIQP